MLYGILLQDFILAFLSSLSQQYRYGQQLAFITAMSSNRSSISSKFLRHGRSCKDAEASGLLGDRRSFGTPLPEIMAFLGICFPVPVRKGLLVPFLDLTGNGSGQSSGRIVKGK